MVACVVLRVRASRHQLPVDRLQGPQPLRLRRHPRLLLRRPILPALRVVELPQEVEQRVRRGKGPPNSLSSPLSSPRMRMSSIRSPPAAISVTRASSFCSGANPRRRFGCGSSACASSSTPSARIVSTTSGKPARAVTSSRFGSARSRTAGYPVGRRSATAGPSHVTRGDAPCAATLARLAPQIGQLAGRQLVDQAPEPLVGGHRRAHRRPRRPVARAPRGYGPRGAR